MRSSGVPSAPPSVWFDTLKKTKPVPISIAEAKSAGITVLQIDGGVYVIDGSSGRLAEVTLAQGAGLQIVRGMHTFGASAPLKALQKKFGFTPEAVYEAAKNQLGSSRKA